LEYEIVKISFKLSVTLPEGWDMRSMNFVGSRHFYFPSTAQKYWNFLSQFFHVFWYFWCFYILVLWALVMLLLKLFFGYFLKQAFHKKSFVENGSPSKLPHGRKMMSMMLWIEKKHKRCMKLEFTKPLFNRVFIKVIPSSPSLWATFHPLSPLWWGPAK
jgi:hypothetical protein